MSEDKKNQAVMALSDEPVKKKGYTIDEMRYQLALKELQKEFCKEKLVNKCHSTLSHAPWSKKSGGGGRGGFSSTLVSSLMKGLSYTDYFMMGFSVFKTAKNVFSFFRRKRK